MKLLPWRSSGPSRLSWDVRNYLRSNHQVNQEALDRWRSIPKNARFGGRKIRLVRIYDPAAANGSPIKVYDDLNDLNGVMFTMQIETNGDLYAKNKRS